MRTVQVLDPNRKELCYGLEVSDTEHERLLASGLVYEDADDPSSTLNHIGVNLASIVDSLAEHNPQHFDNKVFLYVNKETRNKLILFLGTIKVSYDGFIRRAIRASAKGAVRVAFDNELNRLNTARERLRCSCPGNYSETCPRHGDWLKRKTAATKELEQFTRADK
jgi:hypothetical protein